MAFGEPGTFLYHYTSLATAMEEILPSQRLLVNPFSRMNDPREAREWGVSATGWGEDRFPNEAFWDAFQLTNRLKETCKLVCLSEDARPEGEGNAEFARGYARPRMWAHYGDNHRGVCLLFDRGRLHDRLHSELGARGRVFSGQVVYGDAGIPTHALDLSTNAMVERGVESVLDELVESNWRDLFFAKARDWETEREVRYLVRTETEGPEYVSIEGALRAVCLGDAVSAVYDASLYDLCSDYDLDLLKIVWHNGVPIVIRKQPVEVE